MDIGVNVNDGTYSIPQSATKIYTLQQKYAVQTSCLYLMCCITNAVAYTWAAIWCLHFYQMPKLWFVSRLSVCAINAIRNGAPSLWITLNHKLMWLKSFKHVTVKTPIVRMKPQRFRRKILSRSFTVCLLHMILNSKWFIKSASYEICGPFCDGILYLIQCHNSKKKIDTFWYLCQNVECGIETIRNQHRSK